MHLALLERAQADVLSEIPNVPHNANVHNAHLEHEMRDCFGLKPNLKFVLLTLALSLSGCGGSGTPSTPPVSTTETGTTPPPSTQVADSLTTNYSNFESPQTNPIRLSPDGSRLFSVNTAAGRLSVFSLANPSSPTLIAEIPVGLEPVSVWPISNDEAWVVNHVSDSVSVVSITSKSVTDTLPAGDEPCDVLVAGSPARVYVSAARSNQIKVFDPHSHALLNTITLQGEHPRAMTSSPDGSKVYVAFALSGNRTTVVARTASVHPPAEPRVTGLPTAPRVGLIIDATDANWYPSVINYTVLDHDVAEISTATQTVTRYFDRTGTVNLGVAVNPSNGDVFVTNTDARNLVFYEQNLRGHVVDNRITKITTGMTPSVTPIDLNPGVDYSVLPNTSALNTALAQPAGVVFDPSGSFMWVASFGTDRIAKVNAAGSVLSRIEIGGTPGSTRDPDHKRGPRGLALKSSANRLYVQNRISNTISIIDTNAATLISEIDVGTFDPTPSAIKQGRGYLYDAKLSGNGSVSCASCHVDGAVDNLAWNLGNLSGSMVPVTDPISGATYQMHPMKGPMVTQTLAGLKGFAPFHWRGDMADLMAFNRNFDKLMGGTELSSGDMQKLSDFISSIQNHPNPNLKLDRTFAASVKGGDPARGLAKFTEAPGPTGFSVACSSCHSLPTEPFKLQITAAFGDVRQAKVPTLRQVYKKISFDNSAGAINTMGIGETQDGVVSNMGGTGVAAFLMSWDSGTAPAVGFSRTIKASTVSASSADWDTLESQAHANNADLILQGLIDGLPRTFVYSPTLSSYIGCGVSGGVYTKSQLISKVQASTDVFTVSGRLPGSSTCESLGQ